MFYNSVGVSTKHQKGVQFDKYDNRNIYINSRHELTHKTKQENETGK